MAIKFARELHTFYIVRAWRTFLAIEIGIDNNIDYNVSTTVTNLLSKADT